MAASAQELARIDERIDNLIKETDPKSTSELLPDWERNYGLPDECLTAAASLGERRSRLQQRVQWQGGQSIAFFIALMESLGFPGCTITEFRPMRANSACNAALNQNGWRHAWQLNVPVEANVKTMNVTGACNDPLASWGDPGLECLLKKYAPAHSVINISYGVQ